MTEQDALGGLPGPGHHPTDADKPIGRRAFLGLAAAGVVAFVFGRDAFSDLDGWLRPGDSATGTVYKPQPIDLATWHLAVEGRVEKRLKVSWTDFLALPQTDETRDFTCVDGWRVQPRQWEGVRLRELLDLAGMDDSATHVVFHSADAEYTDSLTVSEARSDDIVLAHTCNGELLIHDHGRPLRLVAPDRLRVQIREMAYEDRGHRGRCEGIPGLLGDPWLLGRCLDQIAPGCHPAAAEWGYWMPFGHDDLDRQPRRMYRLPNTY